MTPPPVALLHHNLPIVPPPMHEQQQKRGNRKEDAIHDAKCKACLQHRAVLVGVEVKGGRGGDTGIVNGEGEVAVVGKVGAVGICDVTKLVDASDEGADEAEIYEGDEHGGVAGGFTAEDGDEGPCGGEDGDDEEDTEGDLVSCRTFEIVGGKGGSLQFIVGCEKALLLELVDEVGLS